MWVASSKYSPSGPESDQDKCVQEITVPTFPLMMAAKSGGEEEGEGEANGSGVATRMHLR